MSEEQTIQYVDETAALSEEQWDRLIAYYRMMFRPLIARVATRQFQSSVRNLQNMAGETEAQLEDVNARIRQLAGEYEG